VPKTELRESAKKLLQSFRKALVVLRAQAPAGRALMPMRSGSPCCV